MSKKLLFLVIFFLIPRFAFAAPALVEVTSFKPDERDPKGLYSVQFRINTNALGSEVQNESFIGPASSLIVPAKQSTVKNESFTIEYHIKQAQSPLQVTYRVLIKNGKSIDIPLIIPGKES